MATNTSSSDSFVAFTRDKIQRLTTHAPVLEELWAALFASDPPKLKIRAWLLKHEPSVIGSAFEVAAYWLDRQEEPATVSDERKLKYIGKILSNAVIDGMTPEQKEQRLSDIRSLVGKIGARKKWQNDKNAICHDLPSVATTCYRGSGSGSGSVWDTDIGAGVEAGKSKPAAAAPPVSNVQGKEESKPRTAEPKPPKGHAQDRTCSACGVVLGRDVNHLLECRGLAALDHLDREFAYSPVPPNSDHCACGEVKDVLDDCCGVCEKEYETPPKTPDKGY